MASLLEEDEDEPREDGEEEGIGATSPAAAAFPPLVSAWVEGRGGREELKRWADGGRRRDREGKRVIQRAEGREKDMVV